MKILRRKNWKAIQQEFMKIYAVAMSGYAVPNSFWIQSALRMRDAGVIDVEIKDHRAQESEDEED